MAIRPEDASVEVQRFLVALNASKHSAREKAIRAFRAFVDKQGMEFYDDDVDSVLHGDGYAMGLMQWCGERSTGTQGALKRTAATAISLLKWLVSLQDPSGDGDENIFLARFLQVALEDLRKMRLELHLLIGSNQKNKTSRGGKSEDACEIVSLILQHHRNESGEMDDISVEELLVGEEACKIFVDWLQQTAMGKRETVRLTAHNERRPNQDAGVNSPKEGRDVTGNDTTGAADNQELDNFGDDIPFTWAEVDQEQFAALNDRRDAVVPVDVGTKADEPVPDPLGLKEVDLRVYQKTLMDEETSTNVVMDGGDGETSGTLQSKKRALVGQKDRLRLLKRMQTGKERVQRKMEQGRSVKGSNLTRANDQPESKPVARDTNRSIVPTSEDFDPALFMTVVHSTASFNDIRNGLESLEGAKANQANELQGLVRDHFDSFVRCADSIEKYASHINMELSHNKEQLKPVAPARPTSLAELRMQLRAEREAEGQGSMADLRAGAGPAAKSHLKELARLMEGARTEAVKNFSQLLDKLDNIKQVRAAQHLLSEKGSILDIPREMSACMAEGRYKDLVKLFRKAQTTYSSSILGQVRVEADAVGQQACLRLMEVLRSPDSSLQEQIDAVGYLQDLQYVGEEPLQACFDGQKENFLENTAQCREAMEALLLEAFAYRRAIPKAKGTTRTRTENERDNNKRNNSGREYSSTNRLEAQRGNTVSSPGTSVASRLLSASEDLTDSENFSVSMSMSVSRSSNRRGGRFFDSHQDDVLLLELMAMDTSDDGSFYDSKHREDDGRSDTAAGRMQAGLHELHGMELDDELILPIAGGVDVITHRISLARLQHVSNVAWCLGSWLPHLVSLAVLLIRLEYVKSGRAAAAAEESGGGLLSPQVHIRRLCGPGSYAGGTSDYADGDTASVTTSGPRAASTAHEATSTLDSDEGLGTGKRDRAGTKAEKDLTRLFQRWLNNTTSVLRAAIFGDDTVSDRVSPRDPTGNGDRMVRTPRSSKTETGTETSLLFAGNMQGGLSNKYAGDPHLKEPLDARYLRLAFPSLAHLHDSLSQALGGSWEGDVVLSPGLRALEKLVKEAQAVHVRSEMAALATEAKALMDVDPWSAPEPPHPPGGTRLPHLFGELASQRMRDLVDLLPRAEWSAAEVTHGLGDAVQCLLSSVSALATRAYEGSRSDIQSAVPVIGGRTVGQSEEGLNADYRLLCQLGNCLKLHSVILPEVWETAADLFDASRAGVVSDRKRTQKVQEKVMNKYLKRKYRELKMYVKNGWWGYTRSAPRSGRQDAVALDALSGEPSATRDGDQLRLSTTISTQRTSLRLKRGAPFSQASIASSASAARQASMLSSKSEESSAGGSKSGQAKISRRGSIVNQTQRTGMKAAMLNISMRAPKPKSLPSYLVKVLLSLVQARLEAQEALRGLLYRKAGMHDGKLRKEILYGDYVLRESARQVMEIVCDCANARVVGEGSLGAKPLDGSDPVEQAEKIAQAEFLRDALYRFLPSATLDRVNRVIKRLQTGTFQGTLGRSGGNPSSSKNKGSGESLSSGVGESRQAQQDKDGTSTTMDKPVKPTSTTSSSDKKQPSVSDTLGAAMPGSFLTATDLQELARVYVVCLK